MFSHFLESYSRYDQQGTVRRITSISHHRYCHRCCHRCYCFLRYLEWESTNNATVRHLGHCCNDVTHCDQSLGSHFHATYLGTHITAHKNVSVEWSAYWHALPENVDNVYMQYWKDVELSIS